MIDAKRTIEYVVDVIRKMPYQFTMCEADKFNTLLNERIDEILEIHSAEIEECISRKAVDKAIQEWIENREYDCSNATYYLHKRIDKISSI